jgi:hypothetical protein
MGCAHALQTDQRESTPDFFACTDRVDKDVDRTVTADEWIGIKSSFRAHENILFVGYLREGLGSPYSWRLVGPGAEEVRAGAGTQNYRVHVSWLRYSVRSLINQGGEGTWRMEWYQGGDLIGSIRVILVS